ncbi:hypothetical protein GCM10009827_087350 [Dactylosporangium maewongense]|uniref:Uncharacterized protein n=1 Tax=Dactylosporangium maewongense TaxID=634393 RepID=A0ABP4MZU6_9ACTN
MLWRRVFDPRQYPHSDHVTLSSALNWAQLTLPECGERGTRYWHFGNLFGEVDLLLRMTAPRGCVEQFLAANAAEPIDLEDRHPTFVTSTPDAWGWPDERPLNHYSIPAKRPPRPITELAADLDATPLADLFIHVSSH